MNKALNMLLGLIAGAMVGSAIGQVLEVAKNFGLDPAKLGHGTPSDKP